MGFYGTANHVASQLHKDDGYHRCGCSSKFLGGRAHASSRRRCQRNRWRAEARAHVLPCLRQGGVRRLGDGAGRQGHQGRRRRVGAPEPRSLLREVAVFHARGLSSRSSALPREAHEPQGLGRSRLGAHHAGRGVRAVGPGPGRGRRQVRRTVHLRYVRHVARVVAWPLSGHEAAVRHAERALGLPGLQGPASLGRHHDRRDGLPLDGSGGRAEGVPAVGHRGGVLQLRHHQPHHFGRGPARDGAHLRRSARDAAF